MEQHLKTFVADLHRGAKNELHCDYDLSDKNLYIVGDVYCMANIPKSEVKKQQNNIDRERNILKNRYITGNHERQRDQDRVEKINSQVGVMHGDYIMWGHNRSVEYRSGKHGLGSLMYKLKGTLWVNTLEAIEHGYERELNKNDLERALGVCRHNALKVVIIGHGHFPELVRQNYKGIKVIGLPRGKTQLSMWDL